MLEAAPFLSARSGASWFETRGFAALLTMRDPSMRLVPVVRRRGRRPAAARAARPPARRRLSITCLATAISVASTSSSGTSKTSSSCTCSSICALSSAVAQRRLACGSWRGG